MRHGGGQQAHGLGAAGTTLTGGSYYVYNTPGVWYLNNQSFMMCCSGSITIVDSNTITYTPTWSGAISGSASTAMTTK